MLCLFLNLGGAGQGPLKGGYFPLQSLLYFSRNEKLSRNNKRLLYSDGKNCPEVIFLTKESVWARIESIHFKKAEGREP